MAYGQNAHSCDPLSNMFSILKGSQQTDKKQNKKQTKNKQTKTKLNKKQISFQIYLKSCTMKKNETSKCRIFFFCSHKNIQFC